MAIVRFPRTDRSVPEHDLAAARTSLRRMIRDTSQTPENP
jgi:hypothetical protein